MKICCISDTHGKTLPDDRMPDAEILVHAGDVTNNGKLMQMEAMSEWFRHLAEAKYKAIVWIGGNHDHMLDAFRKENSEYAIDGRLFNYPRVHYLRDSGVTIGDKHFYGTPWTMSGTWAFSEMDRYKRRAIFDKIPLDTDVLITHGPPYTILDRCENGGMYMSVGDLELLGAVERVRPRLHVFGHIHDGYGIMILPGVTFVNAAVTTIENKDNPNVDHYIPRRKPIVVDI